MIRHIRRAEKALGRTCRILMDLGGPKLRTGPVEAGPRVVKLRPERDSFGKVTRPARVWITAASKPVSPPTEAAVSLPVSGGLEVEITSRRPNSFHRYAWRSSSSDHCQILWICEAAYCPVIWATQVLETLAKEGIPSRAEITDAAMGHRAEAVMLNKGPHILRAVQMLDDILQRMEAH